MSECNLELKPRSPTRSLQHNQDRRYTHMLENKNKNKTIISSDGSEHKNGNIQATPTRTSRKKKCVMVCAPTDEALAQNARKEVLLTTRKLLGSSQVGERSGGYRAARRCRLPPADHACKQGKSSPGIQHQVVWTSTTVLQAPTGSWAQLAWISCGANQITTLFLLGRLNTRYVVASWIESPRVDGSRPSSVPTYPSDHHFFFLPPAGVPVPVFYFTCLPTTRRTHQHDLHEYFLRVAPQRSQRALLEDKAHDTGGGGEVECISQQQSLVCALLSPGKTLKTPNPTRQDSQDAHR